MPYPIFYVMKRLQLIFAATLSLCLLAMSANAKRTSSRRALADSVINLVFGYAQTVDTTGRGSKATYAYTKFQMRTNKRNATLMLVPTMYAVAHGGGRKFISEFYSKVQVDKEGKPVFRRLLNVSTIPSHRNTMTAVLRYMVPDIYGETLFQENILSPFHRTNRRYYNYSVTLLPFGLAQVYAYPRIKNTQTVATRAIVSVQTGQVKLVDFEGEYDMTQFYISIIMGKEGFSSLRPVKCDMRANFRFMGNKISGMYTSYYNLQGVLSDSLNNVADTALMAKVRPIKLNSEEMSMYSQYWKLLEAKRMQDSVSSSRKNNFVKDVLWDVVGDNLLNRIQHGFGKQRQGYFRISPIFNPLYMGYSGTKGLVYKFDLRSQYTFDENYQVGIQFKGGYSMKQHRFYLNVPVSFTYSARHEGYLQIVFGNGNRINTNRIARRMLGIVEPKDSVGDFSQGEIPDIAPEKKASLTEFKDNYLRIINHWRFNPKWAIEIGFVSHNRIAVKPEFYKKFGYPDTYTSTAPAIGIEWRPWAEHGPVYKLDYERGFKHLFGGNISYERVEFDIQNIYKLSRRRSVSLRLGTGFYTRKGDHWDFVDYTNFHDNNIPGGWNDDWTGEFEMLSSQWYNASDYYVRGNFTYEAPMLMAAWLPWVGRYVEKERLYVSGLAVKRLHPYTEWGYGVTTRLMTLGVFAAFHNAEFNGIGCRFGFELFRNW